MTSTNKFMQPFFVETEKEALRIFTHNVNGIALWKSNASDYSLYQVGMFNDQDGSMVRAYFDEDGNCREGMKKIISGSAVRKE